MRHSFTALILSIAITGCQPKNGETAAEQLRQQNFRLKKENDSLRAVLEKAERDYSGDTIQIAPDPSPEPSYPRFPGQHAVTLQWISWERPGTVTITPGPGEWYTIKGGQKGDNGNYLEIEGRIKPLNARELEFDGTIESRIDHLNGGKPCIRSGTKYFKATGTRKYWRLQDMINCEGGSVTDYVDIYF